MAKFIVEVDVSIITGPILVGDPKIDSGFKEMKLTGKAAEELFDDIPLQKLQFELVSTNEDKLNASFPFTFENAKRGSVFEVKLRKDGLGLEAKLNGTFECKPRAGVATRIKECDASDFGIRGICWKDGSRSGGFMAFLDGYSDDLDYEQYTKWQSTLPKVDGISVK
jgi:hypothetical protein